MKNFINLVERVHRERFKVVADKLIDEKIPVAFLSVEPFEKAVKQMHEYLFQSNVTNLITTTPPPPRVSSEFQIDCAVTDLKDVSKIHPRPEYIFTNDAFSARVANKYLPDCKSLVLCGRTYSENAYETFMNHLVELQEVYESLIDEESRKTFCGYWLGKLTRQFGTFVHTAGAHYITEGFIPEPGAIFIDGGVCYGETSIKFTELGCKVYGFEMDKENFDEATKRIEKYDVVLENLGLGAYKQDMKYTHAPGGNYGASRLNNQGEETAKVISLDEYVLENNIPRVDCIKLDVEGAELDVLKGASIVIKRWKPILILSAYHKLDDFWTLMSFIKSVRSDYEWALRHYTTSPMDSPFGGFATKNWKNQLKSLGLDVVLRNINECCLLAR